MSLGFNSVSESPVSSVTVVFVATPLYSNTSTFYGATAFNGILVTAPLYSNTSTFYGATTTARVTAPLYSNTSTFYGASTARVGGVSLTISSSIAPIAAFWSTIGILAVTESIIGSRITGQSIIYRNTSAKSLIYTNLSSQSRLRIVMLSSTIGLSLTGGSRTRAILPTESVVAYQLSQASRLSPTVRL